MHFPRLERFYDPIRFRQLIGIIGCRDGQNFESRRFGGFDHGRRIFDNKAIGGFDGFPDFFREQLGAEDVSPWVGLSDGDVLGGDDDAEAIAKPMPSSMASISSRSAPEQMPRG